MIDINRTHAVAIDQLFPWYQCVYLVVRLRECSTLSLLVVPHQSHLMEGALLLSNRGSNKFFLLIWFGDSLNCSWPLSCIDKMCASIYFSLTEIHCSEYNSRGQCTWTVRQKYGGGAACHKGETTLFFGEDIAEAWQRLIIPHITMSSCLRIINKLTD